VVAENWRPSMKTDRLHKLAAGETAEQ